MGESPRIKKLFESIQEEMAGKTEVEKFAKWVNESKVIQVSGGRFRHEWKAVRDPQGKYKYPLKRLIPPNTTPEQYCVEMGEYKGCTAEEYAAELNKITQAIEGGDCKLVVGECRQCFEFILEGEEHQCST